MERWHRDEEVGKRWGWGPEMGMGTDGEGAAMGRWQRGEDGAQRWGGGTELGTLYSNGDGAQRWG